MIKEAAPEMNASSSEAEEERDDHQKIDGERDPDFSQVSPEKQVIFLLFVSDCCCVLSLFAGVCWGFLGVKENDVKQHHLVWLAV